MTLVFRGWIRSVAVLLVLGSAAPAAAGWSLCGNASPNPRRETLWGLPRDDPAIAIGAVVLAVLIVVAVAWVAARVGDKS
jgi:hypothetical protein